MHPDINYVLPGRDVHDRKLGLDLGTPAVAVKPVAVKKAPEAKRPIGVNAAGSRFSERDAAPAEKQFTLPGTQSAMGDFSRAMLPEKRIVAIDAKSGASTPSARKTDELAVGSRANQAAYLERQRLAQNQLNAQKLKASRQAEANQAAMEAIQAKKAAPVPRFAGKGPGLGALSGMKKGGVVKMASSGMTSSKPSSASSRGDGIAQRGKTRGQMR